MLLARVGAGGLCEGLFVWLSGSATDGTREDSGAVAAAGQPPTAPERTAARLLQPIGASIMNFRKDAIPNFLAKMAGDANLGGIEGALKRKQREAEPEDREDREDEAPVVVQEVDDSGARRTHGGSLHFKGSAESTAAIAFQDPKAEELKSRPNRGKPSARIVFKSRASTKDTGKQPTAGATAGTAPKPSKKVKTSRNTHLLSFEFDDD